VRVQPPTSERPSPHLRGRCLNQGMVQLFIRGRKCDASKFSKSYKKEEEEEEERNTLS
jgi:hypothetical protein